MQQLQFSLLNTVIFITAFKKNYRATHGKVNTNSFAIFNEVCCETRKEKQRSTKSVG